MCFSAFAEEHSEKPLYDMKSCVAISLQNNPSLLSAEAKKLSASSSVNYQQALFRPALDFFLGTGYLTGESTSPFAAGRRFDEEGVPVRNVSHGYYTGSLEFIYPVFREGVFFGTQAPSVKIAEAQLRIADTTVNLSREELLYRTVEAYLEVLRAKENIKILEENLKHLQLSYDMTRSKYDLSLAIKSDLLSAESELLNAQKDLENAKEILILRKMNLAYQMGVDPLTEFDIVEGADDTFYASISVSDLRKLVEKAYQKNPQILVQSEVVKLTEEDVNLKKRMRYPLLDFSARYTFTNDYNPPINDNLHVFLGARIPIFDFGRIKSAEQEAEHNLQEQNMALRDVKNNIAFTVGQIVTDIRNLEHLITSEKKAVEAAQELYDARTEEYKQDIVTLSFVLEAQYNLLTAKQALVQSNFDYNLKRAQLKSIVGELSSL